MLDDDAVRSESTAVSYSSSCYTAGIGDAAAEAAGACCVDTGHTSLRSRLGGGAGGARTYYVVDVRECSTQYYTRRCAR